MQTETLETGDPATDQYLADLAECERRQMAHACSVPFSDIFKLVQYLKHDEKKDFDENPRPGHIWTAVDRVSRWLESSPVSQRDSENFAEMFY
jgi:hypothetical protein